MSAMYRRTYNTGYRCPVCGIDERLFKKPEPFMVPDPPPKTTDDKTSDSVGKKSSESELNPKSTENLPVESSDKSVSTSSVASNLKLLIGAPPRDIKFVINLLERSVAMRNLGNYILAADNSSVNVRDHLVDIIKQFNGVPDNGDAAAAAAATAESSSTLTSTSTTSTSVDILVSGMKSMVINSDDNLTDDKNINNNQFVINAVDNLPVNSAVEINKQNNSGCNSGNSSDSSGYYCSMDHFMRRKSSSNNPINNETEMWSLFHNNNMNGDQPTLEDDADNNNNNIFSAMVTECCEDHSNNVDGRKCNCQMAQTLEDIQNPESKLYRLMLGRKKIMNILTSENHKWIERDVSNVIAECLIGDGKDMIAVMMMMIEENMVQMPSATDTPAVITTTATTPIPMNTTATMTTTNNNENKEEKEEENHVEIDNNDLAAAPSDISDNDDNNYSFASLDALYLSNQMKAVDGDKQKIYREYFQALKRNGLWTPNYLKLFIVIFCEDMYRTVIHFGVFSGVPLALRCALQLTNKESIDQVDIYNENPLQLAVAGQNMEIIEILLKAKATVKVSLLPFIGACHHRCDPIKFNILMLLIRYDWCWEPWIIQPETNELMTGLELPDHFGRRRGRQSKVQQPTGANGKLSDIILHMNTILDDCEDNIYEIITNAVAVGDDLNDVDDDDDNDDDGNDEDDKLIPTSYPDLALRYKLLVDELLRMLHYNVTPPPSPSPSPSLEDIPNRIEAQAANGLQPQPQSKLLLTIKDYLMCTDMERTRLVAKPEIYNALFNNRRYIEDRFPVFSFIIYRRTEEALIFERACYFLMERLNFTKVFRNLPIEICEMILKHLTFKDVINIIESLIL